MGLELGVAFTPAEVMTYYGAAKHMNPVLATPGSQETDERSEYKYRKVHDVHGV